jgi:limonene-1,2-epoxide hydrolase
MNTNEQIMIDFIKAWSKLDATELADYFTDDGVYHNIPLSPVTGKKEIVNLIRSFTASWTETNWEIINIISKDNIVIAERVDRTKMKADKSVNLPGVGVFEMEDGRIKIWRDYFDLGMYLKALQ